MTASCVSARDRFASYRDEMLAREERTMVREHLAVCGPCRREASAFDPALLFAAMPAEEVSPAVAAEILAAVRNGIAMKSAEKRIGEGSLAATPFRRLSATAAAVVAAVLLAWTSGPGGALRPVSPEAAGPGAVAGVAEVAGVAAVAGSLAVPAANGNSGAHPLRLSLPAERSGPAFGGAAFGEPDGAGKGNIPADATIYDWNPGGGQPRVVWIVDRSLDI
jgi:Putative zinc-finger